MISPVGLTTILSFYFLICSDAQRQRETTTIADQYDNIVAYDAPDGQVLYHYETRNIYSCRPIPDFGGGAQPFGVGYNYFRDQPVIWTRPVAGSYECADECYRNDCKEFKIIQPFYSGRGKRPQMTCALLWKGCFAGAIEAPIVVESDGVTRATGEVMRLDRQRIYKPNALQTYFTKDTSSYCGGPASGDLFFGGLASYSAEACAGDCLFYGTKICAAFAFDSNANRCYLKTINCSESQGSDQNKFEMEQSFAKSKLDFYIRKPWLSEKYEFQDLIRFDQTECTNSLPGPAVNFSRPDEAALVCRKNANCAGFQCFQYCKEENMPNPWECNEWDPDVQQYECSFILSSSSCKPGVNSVPTRRAFLFVRHDFRYNRPFVAPEFYHRFRRSTTTQSPKKRPGRSEDDLDEQVALLRHLRRIRKAQRVNRLHRMAMGEPYDRSLKRRLHKMRQIIQARSKKISDDEFFSKIISRNA